MLYNSISNLSLVFISLFWFHQCEIKTALRLSVPLTPFFVKLHIFLIIYNIRERSDLSCFLFFNLSSYFLLMTFRKIDNGVEIKYDNGYTIKIKVEGDKLKLREEYEGRPYTDTMFYLSPSQAIEIKKALKEAKSADDVLRLLQGVVR